MRCSSVSKADFTSLCLALGVKLVSSFHPLRSKYVHFFHSKYIPQKQQQLQQQQHLCLTVTIHRNVQACHYNVVTPVLNFKQNWNPPNQAGAEAVSIFCSFGFRCISVFLSSLFCFQVCCCLRFCFVPFSCLLFFQLISFLVLVSIFSSIFSFSCSCVSGFRCQD